MLVISALLATVISKQVKVEATEAKNQAAYGLSVTKPSSKE